MSSLNVTSMVKVVTVSVNIGTGPAASISATSPETTAPSGLPAISVTALGAYVTSLASVPATPPCTMSTVSSSATSVSMLVPAAPPSEKALPSPKLESSTLSLNTMGAASTSPSASASFVVIVLTVGKTVSFVLVSTPSAPVLPAPSVRDTVAVSVSSSNDERSMPVMLMLPNPSTEPVPTIASVPPLVSSI